MLRGVVRTAALDSPSHKAVRAAGQLVEFLVPQQQKGERGREG